MKNTVFMLADQLKQVNGTDIHFAANNIRHTKGLTSVVSVYNNIKPANKVLDELYEWAEKNDVSLKARIKEIERDMSWNEENPV